MSTDEEMSKNILHIYNGILLRHKREWNRAICRDVDGSRDCHTEWSKSEREKQASYIQAHMCNPGKWYRWSYLQSRSRDTDVEGICMETKRERAGWEEPGDWDWYIYTIDTVYKIDRSFPGGSVIRNLPADAGDSGLILESGRSPGKGNGNSL